MVTTVYEAAKEYAERGFSVIPIQKGAKIPAIKWAQFQEHAPSQLDLQSYFAGQDRNIAIVTGPVSGLVVVDIDNPKLFDEYINRWNTSMVAQTPSGGYHLYYKYNQPDIGNPIGKLQAEIDVRGRGGYVLAAPSQVNGHAYKWLQQGDASPLPVGLHDKIIELLNYQVPAGTASAPNGAEDGHNLWLRVMTKGFTPHQHNQEVKDVARYLFRQGMHPDVIMNTLAALNAADPTPLTNYELTATVNSGIRYEQARLEVKTGATKEDVKTFEVLTDFEVQEMVEAYGDVEWLIEDWLPEASLTMVAAMPQNFKTWLALEAAVVVANGENSTPFLNDGKPGKEGLPVLIVQQEDELRKTKMRVNNIRGAKVSYPLMEIPTARTYVAKALIDGKWQTEERPDTLISFGNPHFSSNIYYHVDRQLTLEDDAVLTALENKIKELGIKLVVIDPFYSLAKADDFFAGAARRLGEFKRMRDTYRVSFLLVHHLNKTEFALKDANVRNKLFGSVLVNGAMEALWIIHAEDGERRIARLGKGFDENKDMKSFVITGEKLPEVYNSQVDDITKPGMEGVKGLMLSVLQYVQAHPGSKVKDVQVAFPSAVPKTIATYLARLEGKELLVKTKEAEGFNVYTATEEA